MGKSIGPQCKDLAKINEITGSFDPDFIGTEHEYYNMRPLSRLEYEQKFYVIQVYYFLRIL